MKAVANIPRYVAEEFIFVNKEPINNKSLYLSILNLDKDFSLFTPENTCWISIGEPEENFQHITNSQLDQCPNLKISFWDVTTPFKDIIKGEYTYYPPSIEQAGTILNFLLENFEKSVIVNCAAGISRSGAIARFCSDYLGHSWLSMPKTNSIPNITLYNNLVKLYTQRN